jgi:hypothetical protein
MEVEAAVHLPTIRTRPRVHYAEPQVESKSLKKEKILKKKKQIKAKKSGKKITTLKSKTSKKQKVSKTSTKKSSQPKNKKAKKLTKAISSNSNNPSFFNHPTLRFDINVPPTIYAIKKTDRYRLAGRFYNKSSYDDASSLWEALTKDSDEIFASRSSGSQLGKSAEFKKIFSNPHERKTMINKFGKLNEEEKVEFCNILFQKIAEIQEHQKQIEKNSKKKPKNSKKVIISTEEDSNSEQSRSLPTESILEPIEEEISNESSNESSNSETVETSTVEPIEEVQTQNSTEANQSSSSETVPVTEQ